MEKQGDHIESENQSDMDQGNHHIRENEFGEIVMEVKEHTLEGNGISKDQGGVGYEQTEGIDIHNVEDNSIEEKQAEGQQEQQEQGLNSQGQSQAQDLGEQQEIGGVQQFENVENGVNQNNENQQNQVEQQDQPAENPAGEDVNNNEQAQNLQQQQQQPQQNQEGEDRADLAEEPSIQQFSTLVSAMNNEPFLNEETLHGIYELLQLNSIDMFDEIDTREPTWKEKVDNIMKLRVDLANKKAVALSQIYQKNIPSNEMHSVEKIMAIFKSKQKEIYISKIPSQGPCTCSHNHGEVHEERSEKRQEHKEERKQQSEESGQQERNERIVLDDIVFIRESVGQEEGEVQKNEEEKEKINSAEEKKEIIVQEGKDLEDDNSKEAEKIDGVHEDKDIPAVSQPINQVNQAEQPLDEVQEAEKEIQRLKQELAQNELIRFEQEQKKIILQEKNRQLKEEYLEILEKKRQLREEYNQQLNMQNELLRQQAEAQVPAAPMEFADQQEQGQGQQQIHIENSDEHDDTENNNNTESERFQQHEQMRSNGEDSNSNNIHEEYRQLHQSEQGPASSQPQPHDHCASTCCPPSSSAAPARLIQEPQQPLDQIIGSQYQLQDPHTGNHSHGNPSSNAQDILGSNASGLSMADIQSIMEMQFVDLRKCKSLDAADNSITFDMNNNYSIRIRSCDKVRIDTTSICSQVPHFIFQDHLFPFLTSVELFRVRGVSPEWREMVREIWHKTFKRGMQEQLLATSLCKEIESQFKLLHLRNPFFQKLNVLLHAMVEVVNWDDFNRKCAANELTVSDQKVVIALLRVLGHNMFGYASLNDFQPDLFQTASSSIAVQLKSIVMDSIARGSTSSQDLKFINSNFLQSPDISISQLMADTDKNSIIFALLAKQFFLYSLLKNFITCSSVYMAATKHKLDSISHNFLTANGFLEGAYRILLLRNVSIKNGQIVTDESDDGDKNLLTTPLTRDKPKKSKKTKKRDAEVQVQQLQKEEELHQENVISGNSEIKENAESENKELVQNIEMQGIEKISGQEEKEEDTEKIIDKQQEQVQQQEQEAIQHEENQQPLEVKEVQHQEGNIEENPKVDDKNNQDEIQDEEDEDEDDEEEDEEGEESSESEITQLMKSIFNLNKSNKDDPDIVIKRKTGTLKIFLDQGTKLDIILNTVINFGIHKIQRINQAKEEAIQNVEDQKKIINELQEQFLKNKDQIEFLKQEQQQLKIEKTELLNERDELAKIRESNEESRNNGQEDQENQEQQVENQEQDEIHEQDKQADQIQQNGQEQKLESVLQEEQTHSLEQQKQEEDATNEKESNC